VVSDVVQTRAGLRMICILLIIREWPRSEAYVLDFTLLFVSLGVALGSIILYLVMADGIYTDTPSYMQNDFGSPMTNGSMLLSVTI
jgi:hypothetical protein